MPAWKGGAKPRAPREIRKLEKRMEKSEAKGRRAAIEESDRMGRQMAVDLDRLDADRGLAYIQRSLEAQLEPKSSEAAQDAAFENAIDTANRGYAKQMMMFALVPMMASGSADKESLKRALSTGLACYMLDPTFRDQVRDAFKPRHRDAAGKAAGRTGVAAKDGCSEWGRIQEAFEKDGTRLPLTERSAGMLYVSISKSAYAAMRLPGADAEAIQDRYDAYIEQLQQVAEKDGIDYDRFNKCCRRAVGTLSRYDPTIEYAFAETAGRDAIRAGGTPDKDIPGLERWDGEYLHPASGGHYTGRFTLRRPMSAEQAQGMIADHVASGMRMVKSYEDLADLVKSGMEDGGARTARIAKWQALGNRAFDQIMDDRIKLDGETVMQSWQGFLSVGLEAQVKAHPGWEEKAIRDGLGIYKDAQPTEDADGSYEAALREDAIRTAEEYGDEYADIEATYFDEPPLDERLPEGYLAQEALEKKARDEDRRRRAEALDRLRGDPSEPPGPRFDVDLGD